MDVAQILEERLRALVREEMDACQREFFGYEEAADYLCTSVQSLRSEVKRRRLFPSRKRPTLFHRDELRRWARG